MIKLACNSLISLDRASGLWMDAEEFVEMAYELRLDAVDFQVDRGLRSRDREYLARLKLACLERGLPIGFLGIGGGFIGSAGAPGPGQVGVPLPGTSCAGASTRPRRRSTMPRSWARRWCAFSAAASRRPLRTGTRCSRR